MTTKQKTVKKDSVTFSKEQLIHSKKFSNRKDVLSTVLKSDKQYTIEQVDTLIDDFMKNKTKGKVK